MFKNCVYGSLQHPCIHIVQINGVAVGHTQRYPLCRIRTKGGPLCMQLIFYEV
jgi:hypothetical protein